MLDRDPQPVALKAGCHFNAHPLNLHLECGRRLPQIVEARQKSAP